MLSEVTVAAAGWLSFRNKSEKWRESGTRLPPLLDMLRQRRHCSSFLLLPSKTADVLYSTFFFRCHSLEEPFVDP